MVFNKNEELKRLHSFSDNFSDKITNVVGSMPFLLLNIGWFTYWLLANTGYLGKGRVFDPFPFGLLTTAVSLEAIILSTFVLMSQRRQSKQAELRSELDYRTDLQAEVDIKTIVEILQRLSKKQGVDISDLITDMKDSDKIISEQDFSKKA
jgi:uncharacterized membrane protein